MLAMLMLVMAQTVPGPPGDEVTAPRVTQARRCVRTTGEIMVCGDKQSDRLAPLPERAAEPILPQASAQLSPNKSIRMHAASSSNPTITAPRAMVDLTIKF